MEGEKRADELDVLDRLAHRLGVAPKGETWAGDDAAVLASSGKTQLFCSDMLVEDVHFRRSYSSLADVGWKAMATNLSDIAAMGGVPSAAVVSVAGLSSCELDELYDGIEGAASAFRCALVGGDLSSGARLVISIALLGACERPVLRSGARAGDAIYVTGPLGASSAGLSLLRAHKDAQSDLVTRHRRPVPRIEEGLLAAKLGATSMIDISDGLGIDLERVARASLVGVEIDSVPVAVGASLEDALGGGDDYELVFTIDQATEVKGAFREAGLREPIAIGAASADPKMRRFDGVALEATGYRHEL